METRDLLSKVDRQRLAFANSFKIPLSNHSVASSLSLLRMISNHACWFPEVSQPGQHMETSENPGTWDICPISRKPRKFTCGNRGNLRKPKKLTKKFLCTSRG